MPAFKYRVLAPVIERVLAQEFCRGNTNWVPDYVLGERARAQGVNAKDDDFRRVASDMWHEALIQKLSRRSMYKCLQCPAGITNLRTMKNLRL